MRVLLFASILVFTSLAQAQLTLEVGSPDFSDWSGITESTNQEATFKSGEMISYQYPDGARNSKGFRDYPGYASDWSLYQGLCFEVFLENESSLELSFTLKVTERDARQVEPQCRTKLQLKGIGWQSVYIPWDLLDVPEGNKMGTLQLIKDVKILAISPNNPRLKIRNVYVTKGERVALESPIQGKSTKAGGSVQYEVQVGNTTTEPQNVQLLFAQDGWDQMIASVEPSTLELAPNEVKKCTVEVAIPARLPKGLRGKQILKAVANGKGSAAQTIKFTTAVAIPFPNVVFTADKWQDVKDKIKKYAWAKDGLIRYEEKARRWKVPKPATLNAQKGNYLYREVDGGDMADCATAYQLTGKKEYAEKCVQFIRYVVDPETGYPSTFRGNPVNFVKEGVLFQGIARGYDMILDSGLLTEEDKALAEDTFRMHIKTIQLGTDFGAISNWDVAEVTSALYCALCLQDWHLVDELLHGPTGVYQQFSHGVMSDGWWYECAVGYNLWVASEFSEIAIALEPWGINFKDMQLPLGTSPWFSLIPERKKPGLYGMDFMKWGPLHKNSISIKDMWDAMIPFLDYRGVMFAVNDATETLVQGDRLELAYYFYRDPEYAAVINRGEGRGLLYSVPDLPDVTSEKIKQSAYADNMGIVQLRSQTEGREQREQIQAALHYGSHGGHHGHFDRTGLVSMMRYGRSFYNPEMIWYGYSSYLYKFLVQTSMTKNMVVVDQKMQEPKESFRTLFYTGDMLQATVVETHARWSDPPYGGMRYRGTRDDGQMDTSWMGDSPLPIPENPPTARTITRYTEPILQRRLMVMMDDYVILADFLDADQDHTFDWLFQMKGIQSLTADQKEFLRHDNQMNTDPLSTAQLFTDCNWYKTKGTSRAKFEMCWGPGCDNEGTRTRENEDGTLKIDVFNAWPPQNEVMLGTVPEEHGVSKRLNYSVIADGEVLIDDSTGAWILGSKNIDLDITGKKQLVLTTKVNNSKKDTIFWGDASLIKKDGSEVFISSLPAKYQNILMPPTKGFDYYSGPVKIAGELMANSTPGMPDNDKESGSITIDFTGMDAVRFKAKLGGDFPLGDESARRKTLAVRSHGQETRYLSIIEPYETESMVKSVTATSANELVVELNDGRIQEIRISNLDSDTDSIKVFARELMNGQVVRQEIAAE
ncbi:hypothetical protein ACFL6U_00500 [Planctomycetota bacterium]